MRLRAYQNDAGDWCCSTCHASTFECRCHPGDYMQFHYDIYQPISGISHWMFSRYRCGYDSWLLRVRRACAHIGAVVEGFQCGDVSDAERIETLLHLMRITAKPRKDVVDSLEEVKPKLTSKQRTALALYLEAKTHNEIADEMGVGVPATKRLIQRVKAYAQSTR